MTTVFSLHMPTIRTKEETYMVKGAYKWDQGCIHTCTLDPICVTIQLFPQQIFKMKQLQRNEYVSD